MATRLRADPRVSALVERLQSGDPPPAHETGAELTPEQLLRSVMSDPTQDARLRFDCADSLLALEQRARRNQGKKAIAAERAYAELSGRLATLPLPRAVRTGLPFGQTRKAMTPN